MKETLYKNVYHHHYQKNVINKISQASTFILSSVISCCSLSTRDSEVWGSKLHISVISDSAAILEMLLLEVNFCHGFLTGTGHVVGGFLNKGLGIKGNNTGISVIPIFFPFLKCKEHTRWCSPGIKSFLFILLIHLLLYGLSCEKKVSYLSYFSSSNQEHNTYIRP